MDGTIQCPICNHKAEFTIYPCEYGNEEEYILCNNCGYSYEFAYGGYRIYVGRKCFIWNYTINPNKYKQLMKKISKAEFTAKRNWKKHKKKQEHEKGIT
jgi:hypothetical protein